MKPRLLLPALSLGLVALLGACTADDGEGDAMPQGEAAATDMTAEDALEDLRATWVEHYNMQHPDQVAALYTDSAWILNADVSMDEGRAAVAETHRNAMESQPTVSVTTNDKMVMGDQAVAWGTYEVEATTPEGAADWSGTWLSYFEQVDGEWKITGRISNYDAAPPEGWMWGEPSEETPPEESTMTELLTAYEEAFNSHDADAVAALYAENATVALSFAPVMHGRDALAADLASRFEERATNIDVHGVGTIDLDADHKLDGGWYELMDAASGETVQVGMYLNLLERAEDGSWQVLWSVSNGRPEGAMAGAPAESMN